MKYRAITSENFYFIEMKKACKYLLNNREVEDRKKEFFENDILDAKSENNFRRKYISINRRVDQLSDYLREELVISDSQTSKFLNLYSIISIERIVLEFMEEVLYHNFSCYKYTIEEKDFSKFIEEKSEQSETVANWSIASRKQMAVKLKNFLLESGFLVSEDDEEYKIIRPVILPEIIEEIKENGDSRVLKAMLY